jgi:hypothetical protein
MMEATGRGDQIVDGYLAQVVVELADLPAEQRARIVGEIRARIAQSRAAMPAASEADVFRLLDQLGRPAALAAAARGGLPPAACTGWLEVLAIFGLVLVWPVGVVLLWRSRIWSTGQKVIGTLIPPGGLAVPALMVWIRPAQVNGPVCTPDCPPMWVLYAVGTVLTVVFSVVPLLWLVLSSASTIYLVTRAWRSMSRPRAVMPSLGLVVSAAAAPVVALAIITVFEIVASGEAQPASGAPQAAPSEPALPSPGASGRIDLPNLSPSQFSGVLAGSGFSCTGPVSIDATTWTTGCTSDPGFVVAQGANDHSIDTVVATAAVPQAAPGQSSQLFDLVVQGVCRPADVGRIDAWTHDHVGGGHTDIDGYVVNVSGVGGTSVLTIVRSRP